MIYKLIGVWLVRYKNKYNILIIVIEVEKSRKANIIRALLNCKIRKRKEESKEKRYTVFEWTIPSFAMNFNLQNLIYSTSAERALSTMNKLSKWFSHCVKRARTENTHYNTVKLLYVLLHQRQLLSDIVTH